MLFLRQNTIGIQRRAGYPSPPPLIIPAKATLVKTIQVLGVTDLGISHHLDEVLTTFASSMYALRVLRTHGLRPLVIQEVARMTTLASLMYMPLRHGGGILWRVIDL